MNALRMDNSMKSEQDTLLNKDGKEVMVSYSDLKNAPLKTLKRDGMKLLISVNLLTPLAMKN